MLGRLCGMYVQQLGHENAIDFHAFKVGATDLGVAEVDAMKPGARKRHVEERRIAEVDVVEARRPQIDVFEARASQRRFHEFWRMFRHGEFPRGGLSQIDLPRRLP